MNPRLTANPRFLDRLNAVCTFCLIIVLSAFIFLALQSRAQGMSLELPQITLADQSSELTSVGVALQTASRQDS